MASTDKVHSTEVATEKLFVEGTCPNKVAAFCPVIALQTSAAISESPGMKRDESSNVTLISSIMLSAVLSRKIKQLISRATMNGAACAASA